MWHVGQCNRPGYQPYSAFHVGTQCPHSECIFCNIWVTTADFNTPGDTKAAIKGHLVQESCFWPHKTRGDV